MVNNKGFTLIELIVVMGIFIGVMMMTSYAFENILKKGGQQSKSAETQIEGIVGLEMLRSDLEHAGYGLPWSYPFTPTITETAASTQVTGIDPADYNETNPPRAIRIGTSPTSGVTVISGANTNPGVDYLVVKSSVVALNNTAKKWSYVNYSTTAAGVNSSSLKQWGTNDFTTSDRVITVSSTFTSTGAQDKRLAMVAADNFSYQIPGNTPARQHPPSPAYKPADGSQLFVVYGIDGNNPRMPYNRADYYVKRPASTQIPPSCNRGTGILYKGVVNHADANGAFIEYPLLNCVGDMQVEFELDRNNDGNTTFTSVLTDTGGTPLDALQIRSQLKNISVYILAHEGKKDSNYSFSGDSIKVGTASSNRTWDGTAMETAFGPDWRNYRWKVYALGVRPKNLN
jgi:prepilin-type N-terminal cleavage/methylation domain-containing protein